MSSVQRSGINKITFIPNGPTRYERLSNKIPFNKLKSRALKTLLYGVMLRRVVHFPFLPTFSINPDSTFHHHHSTLNMMILFNANSNYCFMTNQTEYTFEHLIQKCLGSLKNKQIKRIKRCDLAFFEFCSSSIQEGAFLSLHDHLITSCVNLGPPIMYTSTTKVTESIR